MNFLDRIAHPKAVVSEKAKEGAGMLHALAWKTRGRIYEGTVPHAEIQRRRRRNKAAKASRKANR